MATLPGVGSTGPAMVSSTKSDGETTAEESSAAEKNEMSCNPWAGQELSAVQKKLSWEVEKIYD